MTQGDAGLADHCDAAAERLLKLCGSRNDAPRWDDILSILRERNRLWDALKIATGAPPPEAGVREVLEAVEEYLSDDSLWDQGDQIRRKVRAALSSPPPTAGREEIARIIAGDIFQLPDYCVGPATQAVRRDAFAKADAILRLYASPPVSDASLSFICPKCGTRWITDGNASTVSDASREALEKAYATNIVYHIDNWTGATIKRGFASSWHYGELWGLIKPAIIAALAKSFDNTGGEK